MDSKDLKIKIDIENLDDQGVTEISIYTQDHLGLFTRTCAGLALAGTSVQDARIVTTKDGMTVNTFLIRSANSFSFIEDKNRISTLEDTIRKTISEERDPKILIKEFKSIQIPSRKDSFIIEPRVLIDNLSSKTHTLIEINSKDKIGLLHTLASELFLMGLHISTARISTYGVRVVDVFYIKNMTGGKITEKDKIDVIKSKLMKAINEHKDVSSKVFRKNIMTNLAKVSNIYKSSAVVGLWTLCSRIMGFIRDILFASILGSGAVADAFLLAFRIPNLFRKFFAEGAFSAAFIPLLTEKNEKYGLQAGVAFTSNIASLLLFIVIPLIILSEFFMRSIVNFIAPGFINDIERLELAIPYARIVFPYLVFIIFTALFASALNTSGRFWSGAAAPVILNVF